MRRVASPRGLSNRQLRCRFSPYNILIGSKNDGYPGRTHQFFNYVHEICTYYPPIYGQQTWEKLVCSYADTVMPNRNRTTDLIFLHLIWQHSVMYSSDFRMAVVSVYNSFQSMKRVALLFKISPSTVHRWIKDPRPRCWPKKGSKFTDAMVAMVRLRLHMFPSTAASQLVALIREQLGATVSRQLVALVLKTQLNTLTVK
jgi:transposase-like protein